MRGVSAVMILSFLVVLPCLAQNSQDDSITITTFYPSPYGSYGVLQLYPRQSDPSSTDAPCNSQTGEGSMYYNSVTKSIHICQEDSSNVWGWVSIGGGGLWNYTDATQTNISNINTGNVGIGTTDPQAKLDVNGQIRINFGNPIVPNYVLTAQDATGKAVWKSAFNHLVQTCPSGQTIKTLNEDGTVVCTDPPPTAPAGTWVQMAPQGSKSCSQLCASKSQIPLGTCQTTMWWTGDYDNSSFYCCMSSGVCRGLTLRCLCADRY